VRNDGLGDEKPRRERARISARAQRGQDGIQVVLVCTEIQTPLELNNDHNVSRQDYVCSFVDVDYYTGTDEKLT
jgi:hypothetical protein